MSRPTKRDQLIDCALELFRREGYHATGVDRIVNVAGVAKMTLYKHFASKEELILAALQRRDEGFSRTYAEELARPSLTPRARLLAVFDVLEDFIHDPAFSGCMFINASAEFADPEHPIHRATVAHKTSITDRLAGLAEEAGARDPGALAEQLSLLFDGALVTAQIKGPRDTVRNARDVAEKLVDQALRPS